VQQDRMLKDGKLDCYWIQVNNNPQAAPNSTNETYQGYRNPDNFIVVSDAYPTVTAMSADLILPAAITVWRRAGLDLKQWRRRSPVSVLSYLASDRRVFMNAADIMTPTVVSADPDLPVAEVAKLMLSRGISAIPVVAPDGTLVGIVSEGDLVRRAELGTERRRPWWLRALTDDVELADEYAKSRGRKARDVMTPSVITVDETTPIADIVDLLEKHRIKRVPVVREGRVVGIVSRANLLRAFASEAFREPRESSDEDRAIRARLLDELKRQPWWHGRDEDIVVSDRTVHLWGTVRSARERDALAVAAENTPGVRRVENHVNVVEPTILYAMNGIP